MTAEKITYTCTDGQHAGKTLTNGAPGEIVGRPCVMFGGCYVTLYTDEHPELAAAVAAYAQAEASDPVPGLDELRQAYSAANQELDHRIDYGDGAMTPRRRNRSIIAYADQLAQRYPRAAAYLRAEASAQHATYTGYAASDQMAALLRGESLEAVNAIMDRVIAKATAL